MSTTFHIVKPRTSEDSRQRLGRLILKGRNDIPTPNLLALATRGFVPHLTPDILQKETNILAVHAGFEDFLGPRRASPVPSNNPNTYTSLNICTSLGHRDLEISIYLEAIAKSRPDVIIAPVDIEFGRHNPGAKRRDKIVERSTAWLRSFETALKETESNHLSPAAWVPILPLEAEIQRTYLDHLEEVGGSFIQGIVVYDPGSTVNVPEAFHHLPLVSLTEPRTPHDVLRLVVLGTDIIAAPFITAASEAGIALDFDFPVKTTSKFLALGTDMWSEVAYIQHLLSAKEMLAWVLLQIHNHHVVDKFFNGIRESIARNTFEADVLEFTNAYQSELPVFQGQGPRIRGYHASLGADAKKLNQAPFKKMGHSTPARHNDDKSMSNDMKDQAVEVKRTKAVNPDVMDDFDFDGLINQSRAND
ncbi:MAG: hypothetical protein GOMPHAMPRED_008060 [Gomphillus americanus]|uniref:tRNA-guanine(15) transglycosylase-like domain-containing protein n=1 Tax=Gomphillus americanus TaxID=1940652 RepID=A0A8H3EYF4_9LECA|nr:MAG: hypothetical protein GOMPHAMPRED_008060 [Gomphillus americanus]